MTMRDQDMRNQKKLLPALQDQAAEDYELTEITEAYLLGRADLPREQDQPEEEFGWSAVSLLVLGETGSGLSTVLGTAVVQFASQPKPGKVVIIDPTTAFTDVWDCYVGGEATWTAVGNTADAITQLTEQLEAIVIAPAPGQRVLVVIDRLDQVVLQLDPGLVERIAKLISGAARAGIAFVCSADSRTTLDRGLRHAFATRYAFTDTTTHLLRKDGPEYLVRPYRALPTRQLIQVSDGLPIGPVPRRRLAEVLATVAADDHITLGVDDLTHGVVEVVVSETFVVTGSSPEARATVLRWYCDELRDRGFRVGAIGAEEHIGHLPDLIDILVREYDEIEGGEPDAKVETLLKQYEHVAVFEAEKLLLTLRRRTAELERPHVAAMILTAIQQKLGRGQLGVVMHGSFRLPPFQSIDWQVAQLQLAAWVYLDPRSELHIPGNGGGALEKSHVAARPRRLYGPGDAVCLIEGVRHELRGLPTE